LHDLCVSLESVTPGELKRGGSGLRIVFGIAATPFGECLVGESGRGICHLAFVDGEGADAALDEFHTAWPEASLMRSDRAAADLASRIFERPVSNNARPTLRALVKGTAFQVQVWRALLRVPPGCLVTYGQLATAIGAPGAARAVGSAVGHNTLAYLIPCHRVIRETGIIGDYRWGRVRKRAMVAWETSHRREPRGRIAAGRLRARVRREAGRRPAWRPSSSR
jgi:AraC family transcriptional regulator of adaptative response/methylated-DNA-[protein]-cysteine methyltransferase